MKTKTISERLMNTNVGKKEKGNLGKHVVVINCIMCSVITVLVVMVFAFIKMLFSSAEDGRRETFFNTIYFEAITLDNGNTKMNLGATGSMLPIVLSILVVFIVYYGMYLIINKKKKTKI